MKQNQWRRKKTMCILARYVEIMATYVIVSFLSASFYYQYSHSESTSPPKGFSGCFIPYEMYSKKAVADTYYT